MGGAFIGVADDATAASWNPAGLIQLEKPEVSAVYSYFDRRQTYTSPSHPEIATTNAMDTQGLNYASIVYPFVWLNRNMVISLNYQRLFEMDKNIAFKFNRFSGLVDNNLVEVNVSFDQSGYLYTLSPAMAVQLTPELYLGVTLNSWRKYSDYENGWDNTYREVGTATVSGIPRITNVLQTQDISFEGHNAHIGFMWLITDSLTLGGVYKAPFDGHVWRKSFFVQDTVWPTIPFTQSGTPVLNTEELTMKMPASYGLGLAYRHSDKLTVALDAYTTDWEEFVIVDSVGNRSNPIDNSSETLKNTTQLRLGTEYLFIRDKYVVPVRAGLFYDPEPGTAHINEFYGFSLGTGYSRGRVVLDMSYQFRITNDSSSDIPGVTDSNYDVDQYSFMFSAIYYFE
jgi:long-subunit fatty acid transport protein